MYSPKKSFWYPLQAYCDSGTKENWIATRIAVHRLNLAIESGFTIITTDFNGNTLASGDIVTVTFTCQGGARTYETNFRVSDNLPLDVLFGYNFLNQEEINHFLREEINPAVPLVQSPVSVRAFALFMEYPILEWVIN